MQSGEIWNMGVFVYTLYQGEFPFEGETDDQVITNIISRPNNWAPIWREGLFDSLKSFIMMCLECDPYKRVDKVQYMNHPYILQHHTP